MIISFSPLAGSLRPAIRAAAARRGRRRRRGTRRAGARRSGTRWARSRPWPAPRGSSGGCRPGSALERGHREAADRLVVVHVHVSAPELQRMQPRVEAPVGEQLGRGCLVRRRGRPSIAMMRSARVRSSRAGARSRCFRCGRCISTSSACCTRRSDSEIERRGRFVEDQDRRVLVDRAGDRHALALTAGGAARRCGRSRCRDALRQRRRRTRSGWRRRARGHARAVERGAEAHMWPRRCR